MKQNLLYIQVILALTIFTVLSSCQTKTDKEANLDFAKYQYSKKAHLFDNDNYPSFNIDLRILLPSDSIAHEALYHALANTYFNSLYNFNLSPLKNLEQFSFSSIKEYKDLEKDFVRDSADIGASLNWEMISKNEIIYKGNKIVSFSNESYLYSGGAHGNTMKTHYVFDLESKDVLSSNEVFKPKSCNAIIDLQKKALEKEGVNIEEIYTDGFTCENNFYFTKEGIYFHYNQYEIASYADGPIDIFISIEEIKPHLQRLDLMN